MARRRRRRNSRWLWIAVLLVVLAAGVGAWMWNRPTRPKPLEEIRDGERRALEKLLEEKSGRD